MNCALRFVPCALAVLPGLLLLGAFSTGQAQILDSLVPNLCPRACNLESYGHEYLQNQVLFRFDNAIANKGDSALLLLSGNIFGPANCVPGTTDRTNCSLNRTGFPGDSFS
jgi:hypothetical protein